jgi:hypothetical protein
VRITESVPPPALQGMMCVIGLVGKSCAAAPSGPDASIAKPAMAAQKVLVIVIFTSLSVYPHLHGY